MDTILCPKCGTATSRIYTNCLKCGNHLAINKEFDYEFCPECDGLIVVSEGKCRDCGYSIIKDKTQKLNVSLKQLQINDDIETQVQDNEKNKGQDNLVEKRIEQSGFVFRKVDGVTCPECGAVNNNSSTACVECGYPIKQAMNINYAGNFVCSECGANVPEGRSECPECGCPVEPQVGTSKLSKHSKVVMTNKNYKTPFILGLVFGILALITVVSGIRSFKKSNYSFLQSQISTYEGMNAEYQGLYDDMKSEADSYKGGFFKNSYEGLASSYKTLQRDTEKNIEECKAEMKNILVRTIIIEVFAAVLFVLSVVMFFGKHGISFISSRTGSEYEARTVRNEGSSSYTNPKKRINKKIIVGIVLGVVAVLLLIVAPKTMKKLFNSGYYNGVKWGSTYDEVINKVHAYRVGEEEIPEDKKETAALALSGQVLDMDRNVFGLKGLDGVAMYSFDGPGNTLDTVSVSASFEDSEYSKDEVAQAAEKYFDSRYKRVGSNEWETKNSDISIMFIGNTYMVIYEKK